MEWQPIESAPKDGTWILTIISGLWAGGTPYLPAVVRWEKRYGEGWLSVEQEDNGEGPMHEFMPTHWMPLPAPPTA